jgi:hypothetical protein
MKKTLLLAALIAAAPLPVLAEIYRWVDAQGRVHYTQTPPPDRPAATVRPAAPPAGGGDNGLKQYAEQIDKQRGEQQKQQAEADAEKQQRAVRCDEAQRQLKRLGERPPNRWATQLPDGSYERWTSEKYDEQLGQARQAAERDCGR